MLPPDLLHLFQNSSMEIVSDNAPSHRKRKQPPSFADPNLPAEIQRLFQYEPQVIRDNAHFHARQNGTRYHCVRQQVSWSGLCLSLGERHAVYSLRHFQANTEYVET